MTGTMGGGGFPPMRGGARRATSRAQEYLREPQRLVKLLEDASRASLRPPQSPLDDTIEQIKALTRLGLAYSRGEYREIPREKLLLAVGAILYFVSPIDVIPDALGLLGLSDDALVLTFLLRRVRQEIDRFLVWEAEHANLPSAEIIDVTRTDGPGPPA